MTGRRPRHQRYLTPTQRIAAAGNDRLNCPDEEPHAPHHWRRPAGGVFRCAGVEGPYPDDDFPQEHPEPAEEPERAVVEVQLPAEPQVEQPTPGLWAELREESPLHAEGCVYAGLKKGTFRASNCTCDPTRAVGEGWQQEPWPAEDEDWPSSAVIRLPPFQSGAYRHVQTGALVNAICLASDGRFRDRILVLYFTISPPTPGPMARVSDLEQFRGMYAWRGPHPTREMLDR